MAENLFQYATRNKLRFQSTRGELTAEQLWDVPLRSRDDFKLNGVAQAASKAWKAISEESFVETAKTVAHTRLEMALEVVKYVIETKLAEEAVTSRSWPRSRTASSASCPRRSCRSASPRCRSRGGS